MTLIDDKSTKIALVGAIYLLVVLIVAAGFTLKSEELMTASDPAALPAVETLEPPSVQPVVQDTDGEDQARASKEPRTGNAALVILEPAIVRIFGVAARKVIF